MMAVLLQFRFVSLLPVLLPSSSVLPPLCPSLSLLVVVSYRCGVVALSDRVDEEWRSRSAFRGNESSRVEWRSEDTRQSTAAQQSEYKKEKEEEERDETSGDARVVCSSRAERYHCSLPFFPRRHSLSQLRHTRHRPRYEASDARSREEERNMDAVAALGWEGRESGASDHRRVNGYGAAAESAAA